MRIDEFEQWLDKLESEAELKDFDEADKEKLWNEVHKKIRLKTDMPDEDPVSQSPEDDFDADKVLEDFCPEQYILSTGDTYKCKKKTVFFARHSWRKGIAAAIIVCAVGLGISAVAYAAVTGQLFGVYKSTPELDAQLDKPNETQEALDSLPADYGKELPDKYTNTKIIDESFFDEPAFYRTVTDYALTGEKDGSYAADEFIFNSNDVAVLTKEDGESWYLEQGQSISFTVAIDTSFAGCEPRGEYIELAYITNGRYIPFVGERIADEPQSFTFVVPESGEYYFGIANATITYVKVTELEIE